MGAGWIGGSGASAAGALADEAEAGAVAVIDDSICDAGGGAAAGAASAARLFGLIFAGDGGGAGGLGLCAAAFWNQGSDAWDGEGGCGAGGDPRSEREHGGGGAGDFRDRASAAGGGEEARKSRRAAGEFDIGGGQ